MFKEEDYRKRIVDERVDKYLKIFPALSIVGPKFCGKTWTSKKHSNSSITLADEEIRRKVKIDKNLAFTGIAPQLIDEWNFVPEIWDKVRNLCDDIGENGQFILTCSSSLSSEEQRAKIFHSGTGRFAPIQMRTMSLFESGESSGQVSLQDIASDKFDNVATTNKPTLEELAHYIVRGGWPKNIMSNQENCQVFCNIYLENIISNDLSLELIRDSHTFRMLLKSLARNESTPAGISTLARDIYENNDRDKEPNWRTIGNYLDILYRLYIIEDQPAFNTNCRSASRISKTAIRRFADPSLSCAALGIGVGTLVDDLRTLGLLFESLVVRDLRVYTDETKCTVSHFRENVSGSEVDTILEYRDGSYGAIEIKLSMDGVDKAIASLSKFYNLVQKKPKFMMVIVGVGDIAYRDKDTGIYVVPITMLKD